MYEADLRSFAGRLVRLVEDVHQRHLTEREARRVEKLLLARRLCVLSRERPRTAALD